MQTITHQKLNSFKEYVADANKTDSVSSSFEVAPEYAQRIIALMRESIEFLNEINILPAYEHEGTAVTLSSGSIAGRTNTELNRRIPKNLQAEPVPYACKTTYFDAAVPFKTLDSLAHYPDFDEKLEKLLAYLKGLDQLTIGWHGVTAAEETDLETYGLLQDVNVGWLAHIRANAPERVIESATIGAEGDFLSLDLLVAAAIEKLDPNQRKKPGLSVFICRDLLHTKTLASIKAGASSIEAEAALSRILATGRLAGLPIRDDIPNFPDDTLLVTSADNLSIYTQEGSTRNFLLEEPSKNRLASYQSQNDAYAVEDYAKVGLVENISFLDTLPEG